MKKTILSFLILALLVTNVGFVALADTENNGVLSCWDGVVRSESFAEITTPLTKSQAFYPTENSKMNSIKFSLQSSGTGDGVTSVTENSNSYYNVKWSNLQSNYRTNIKSYLTTETPVLSFSYDIRIPEENSTEARKTTLLLTSSGTSASANKTEIIVNYNGEFSVSTTNVNTVNSKTASYIPGEWTKVEIRTYLTENKANIGVYVGDNQIYYGTGTSDYTTDFAVRQINFTTGDGTVAYETHLDDIKISTLPEAYKPTEITETVDYITCWDGIVRSESFNEITTILTKSQAFYPTENSEINSTKFSLVSSGTGDGVTSVTENSNSYYNVKWSNIQSNYRTNIKSYLTTETPVLSFSYDIRIPAESSTEARKTTLLLTSNGNSASADKTEIIVNYNGEFSVSTTNVNTVNSKTASYIPGKWTKVEIRTYLTENKANIGVYVGGNQIYYGTGTSDYTTDFAVRQINFATGDGTVAYETHLDDIKISTLSEAHKPDAMIKLSLEQNKDSNSIESKAKITTVYNNLCLITAVYNNKNAVEKIWIDNTIENGFLSNTVSGNDYVKAGYMVKSFIFDSLQTAIPQSECIGLTIE